MGWTKRKFRAYSTRPKKVTEETPRLEIRANVKLKGLPHRSKLWKAKRAYGPRTEQSGSVKPTHMWA